MSTQVQTGRHKEIDSDVSTQLLDTLTQIESFARRHDLEYFADRFAQARACLSAQDPLTAVFHRDLAPGGALTLRGARLLACSQAAWVFGGMGSWNDLGFDGPEQSEYLQVTNRLYDLINRAISAGANSTAPGH
ncbi:MAG: hypothetical protein HY287_05240 [Planctomycetes bacterium]|nr:hypothetical protein [Planctomycetota bacterium]MBI3833717.1 hypothetical protein [Planctomycetota bacterium]